MNAPLTDDTLERLGIYFVATRIQDQRGITFEEFLELYALGMWNTGCVEITWPLDVKAATEAIPWEAV